MRMLQWAAFYRLVGSSPALYDPEAVGRSIGYNLLIIAVVGDGLSPLLTAYAAADGLSAEVQSIRYQNVKIVLLCILVPSVIALPWYLRRCAPLGGRPESPHPKSEAEQ